MKSLPVVGFALLAVIALVRGAAAQDGKITMSREDAAMVFKSNGKEVVRYHLERPTDSKLPVESGAYFHPVRTPAGVVVTDVAPADHPHHRGIFLAWVEMHGKKDADFWGWGEHAPTKGRRVSNFGVATPPAAGGGRAFKATNAWRADDEFILHEVLMATVRGDAPAKAHVIDLEYTLTPTADLTLSRWAFSGFCVRARGEGKLTAYSPAGEVKLPNPSHVKPESDWPAAPWYGYTLKSDDGKTAGVAVIDHPKNPPSLWHNHRDIRMLNPCIVAPGEVKLKANDPLVLRYRVVAHDGETPRAALDALASEWATQDTGGPADKGSR
jgi:hypothetical protein